MTMVVRSVMKGGPTFRHCVRFMNGRLQRPSRKANYDVQILASRLGRCKRPFMLNAQCPASRNTTHNTGFTARTSLKRRNACNLGSQNQKVYIVRTLVGHHRFEVHQVAHDRKVANDAHATQNLPGLTRHP